MRRQGGVAVHRGGRPDQAPPAPPDNSIVAVYYGLTGTIKGTFGCRSERSKGLSNNWIVGYSQFITPEFAVRCRKKGG